MSKHAKDACQTFVGHSPAHGACCKFCRKAFVRQLGAARGERANTRLAKEFREAPAGLAWPCQAVCGGGGGGGVERVQLK